LQQLLRRRRQQQHFRQQQSFCFGRRAHLFLSSLQV
jgi:hypothetical protein